MGYWRIHRMGRRIEIEGRCDTYSKSSLSVTKSLTEIFGILERNPSTKWSNPVFVVPKKQPNVFRVVSDMRSLNEMSQNDNITTKPITQTIREIQAVNAKFFSGLDVQSAFHAIRYKPGTAEPTSIYVELPISKSSEGKNLSGSYTYKRLVMGCKTSSAALHRVME